MKHSAKDIYAFSKWVFAEADAGRISQDTADDLVEWGNQALKSYDRNDGTFDTPPQFARHWNRFAKSKDYQPDTDSLLLSLEQQGKPTPWTPPQPQTDRQSSMNMNFFQRLDQLTGATKSAFKDIEIDRRGGSDSELDRSLHKAFGALAAEQHISGCDPVAKLLQDPEKRELWEAIGRRFTGGRLTDDQRELLTKALVPIKKAFTPGISPSDDFGGGMFLAAAVSEDVLYASYQYGAWKDLGPRILTGARMKYPIISTPAHGLFITPTNQGKVLLESDAFISGNAICELANSIVCMVELSLALVEDGKTVLSEAVLTALTQGHSKALDYACFVGNGADDATNGLQTGIFNETAIAGASAAKGITSVGALTRDDFIGAIAAVDPSALTREPRWYLSSLLLPKLLKLRDGAGPQYLIKTPAETGGPWTCLGFPITWSVFVPGIDQPGQKVAAFGAPDGYLVALQEKLEILASDASAFTRVARQLRLVNRGFVQTRQSNWFATLALAAQ